MDLELPVEAPNRARAGVLTRNAETRRAGDADPGDAGPGPRQGTEWVPGCVLE